MPTCTLCEVEASETLGGLPYCGDCVGRCYFCAGEFPVDKLGLSARMDVRDMIGDELVCAACDEKAEVWTEREVIPGMAVATQRFIEVA